MFSTVAAKPAEFASEVCQWVRREALALEINTAHTNAQYLPGATFGANLVATTDAAARRLRAVRRGHPRLQPGSTNRFCQGCPRDRIFPCGQLPLGSLEYESGDEAKTSSGADRVETLGRAGARGPRGAQPLQIGRSVSADMCGI